MDDLTKILLTSSLTAIGAILVFVMGQILGKLVIEPIQDLKKTLGEIRYALVFHAQAIMTPVGDREEEDKASEALRRLACDLRSKVGAIPFYGRWRPFQAASFQLGRTLSRHPIASLAFRTPCTSQTDQIKTVCASKKSSAF